MSDQHAKKLNLTLHLNPAASAADAVAVSALQAWYKEAKQHSAGNDALNDRIRSFHHDLYLAGLCLHQVAPALCRYVANALEQDALTGDALLQQLSARGFGTPVSAGSGEHDTAALATLTAQLETQNQQIAQLHSQLKQMTRLLESQGQQLNQLGRSSTINSGGKATKSDGQTEEMDVSGMESQIAQMQKIRKKGVF